MSHVLVVGAGPAGLAVAAGLRSAGLEPVVVDRAPMMGSAWHTRYDSFHLHTIRWLSGLPGLAVPRRFGSWVGRDDFIRYLRTYARRAGIEPRLGVEAQGLHRLGAGWCVATSEGPLDTDLVVLATGANNEPYLPDWPGRTGYRRPLIHSSAYRSPGPFRGQKVLVVGAGNSAAEIAVDLSSARIDVELAVRTSPVIVRRDVAGLPVQLLGIALDPFPVVVADRAVAALRRVSVPDLTGLGLPPPQAPVSQFGRTRTVPLIDHGFVAAVQGRRIRVRPAVAALDGEDVLHTDGSRTRPDAVVAATGYRPGLEALPGPLGLLDARGLPTVDAAGRAEVRGLYTVGISIPLTGLLREIRFDARRVVAAAAR